MASGGYRPNSGRPEEEDTFEEIPDPQPGVIIEHLRNRVAFLEGMLDLMRVELQHKQVLLKERNDLKHKYQKALNRLARKTGHGPVPEYGKGQADANTQRHRKRGAYGSKHRRPDA